MPRALRIAQAGGALLLTLFGAAGGNAEPACAEVPAGVSAGVSAQAGAGQYTPARLAARAEIEDRVHDWARAVDRRDWALARTLFYPGTMVDHGKVVSAEGLIADLAQRHRDIPMAMHKISNIRIEFVNDALALAESYVLSIQRIDGADLSGAYTVSAARYIDRFERRCENWKIAARSTVYDGAARFEAAGGAVPPAGWAVGSRGGDDPLELARKALGLTAATQPDARAPAQ